jgi:hypothetical protein
MAQSAPWFYFDERAARPLTDASDGERESGILIALTLLRLRAPRPFGVPEKAKGGPPPAVFKKSTQRNPFPRLGARAERAALHPG